MSIWTFIEYLANFVEAFIIIRFITGYLGIKEKFHPLCIFSFLTLLFFSTINFMNKHTEFEGFSVIYYIALLFIISVVFLNGKLNAKLFISVLCIVLIAIINILTLTVFGALLGEEISTIAGFENMYRLMILFITKFLFFLTTYFLLNSRNKTISSLNRPEYIMVITIFITSLIIVILLFEIIYNTKYSKIAFRVFVISISVIIANNLITFYLSTVISRKHLKELQLSMLEVQLTQQTKSIAELNELSLEMRKIRHDMSKYIDVVSQLITEGQYQKALDYLDDVKSQKFNRTFNMVSTSGDIINAVLNSKLSLCKKLNINTDFQITGDFNGFSEFDLSVLLENLLDNAIEAAQKSEKPLINIKISENKAYLMIAVSNSIKESVLKNNPHFKTDKADKNCHGLGILSIKDIVEKYSGIINVNEENLIITVDILLKRNLVSNQKQPSLS